MAIKGTVIAATTSIGTIISGALGVQVLEAVFHNIDSGTVYLGGVDVGTLTTGYRLTADAAVSMSLFANDIVYGIVPTGTVQVNILLRGVAPQ